MRDRRFVAEHRGGPLSKVHHILLMKWACACTEHVIFLGGEPDTRVVNALETGMRWTIGKATVGEARKAAVGAIRAANEANDAVSVAVARSGGHAVATAHMADHSLGAAMYALKAIRAAGSSVDDERKWQNEQLPMEIRDLVITGRDLKEKHFRI